MSFDFELGQLGVEGGGHSCKAIVQLQQIVATAVGVHSLLLQTVLAALPGIRLELVSGVALLKAMGILMSFEAA